MIRVWYAAENGKAAGLLRTCNWCVGVCTLPPTAATSQTLGVKMVSREVNYLVKGWRDRGLSVSLLLHLQLVLSSPTQNFNLRNSTLTSLQPFSKRGLPPLCGCYEIEYKSSWQIITFRPEWETNLKFKTKKRKKKGTWFSKTTWSRIHNYIFLIAYII